MARSDSYTYNPQTGEWTKSTTSSESSTPSTTQSITSSGGSTSSPTPSTNSSGTSGSNLTSSTSDKDTSTGATEKKYNEIEINTLTGQLAFIVTEETIKLKVGDTIDLQGLGKYLSGLYYIKEISRSISTNGYSHSATVIRPDFGDKLKTETNTQTKSVEGQEPQEEVVQETPVASTPAASTTPERTYTVVKGDCLWNIAKKYYGDGSQWNKIYDANTGKIANPNLIYPGQVFVIP